MEQGYTTTKNSLTVCYVTALSVLSGSRSVCFAGAQYTAVLHGPGNNQSNTRCDDVMPPSCSMVK